MGSQVALVPPTFCRVIGCSSTASDSPPPFRKCQHLGRTEQEIAARLTRSGSPLEVRWIPKSSRSDRSGRPFTPWFFFSFFFFSLFVPKRRFHVAVSFWLCLPSVKMRSGRSSGDPTREPGVDPFRTGRPRLTSVESPEETRWDSATQHDPEVKAREAAEHLRIYGSQTCSPCWAEISLKVWEWLCFWNFESCSAGLKPCLAFSVEFLIENIRVKSCPETCGSQSVVFQRDLLVFCGHF